MPCTSSSDNRLTSSDAHLPPNYTWAPSCLHLLLHARQLWPCPPPSRLYSVYSSALPSSFSTAFAPPHTGYTSPVHARCTCIHCTRIHFTRTHYMLVRTCDILAAYPDCTGPVLGSFQYTGRDVLALVAYDNYTSHVVAGCWYVHLDVLVLPVYVSYNSLGLA